MPATAAKVLMIATDGFENSELFRPRQALIEAGADVVLASLALDPITGVLHDDAPGDSIRPDMLVGKARSADYAMLILPGGVKNPDTMRMNPDAVRLIREFVAAGKPVGAICHAPWLLAEAEVIDGRTVTAWPSIRTDMRHAGATVVDEEVVVDGNIITSRQPEDIPAFNDALLAALGVKARADA